MRQLLPHPADDVDPAAVYLAADRPAPPDRPWVLSDFVASVDGSATANGRSGGLSGPPDRAVFHILRELADVVLVGASTVRVERYRPARPTDAARAARRQRGQAPVPSIAVVTQTLQFDWGTPFFAEAEVPPIVVTSASADPAARARADRVADVLVAGDERVDLRAALVALRERGHAVVLTEGGPTVHGELAEARLLDEVCLTISPRLVGGEGPRITHGASYDPPVGLRIDHLLEDEGFLFLRYVRQHSSPG